MNSGQRQRPRHAGDWLPQFVKTLTCIHKHPETFTLSGWARWLRFKALERTGGLPMQIPFSESIVLAHQGCAVSSLINSMGFYDPGPMRFMQKVLKPGDHFIDVGANVGSYSLLAAECVRDDGRVAALEPDPLAVKRWCLNKRINGYQQMDIFAVAAGSEDGHVSFGGPDGNAANRIDPSGGDKTVPLRRLDGLIRAESLQPTGIKIDVEGYEFGVLAGLGDTLDADALTYIQFEANGLSETTETPLMQSVHLLRSKGFKLFTLDVHGGRLSRAPQSMVQSPDGDLFAVGHVGADRLKSSGIEFVGAN